ncbi:MAG TPA: hypothetical protein VMZ28_15540 [Kofleriaceae bacterium]|nr:hypothetical protein [Kofleriaceae bacterium]
MSAYRDPPTVPSSAAPSREGPVRLESGPQHVRLELGPRWRLTVSGKGAVWTQRRRRGERARELPLGPARLWVARAHPTRDLAVWYESAPGVAFRLGGVRPVDFFAHLDPLAAWRALDRLAAEVVQALAPWSGGVTDATELGRGEQRVLLTTMPDRLVVHARPIFRERPRRVLEVCADGTLVLPGRRGDRRARVSSRLAVNALGDRIGFADEQDRLVASLWLPWLEPEDRTELARRFGELVDPSPPEPDTAPRQEVIRPWDTALGRRSAVARFLPLPLPTSARFRR